MLQNLILDSKNDSLEGSFILSRISFPILVLKLNTVSIPRFFVCIFLCVYLPNTYHPLIHRFLYKFYSIASFSYGQTLLFPFQQMIFYLDALSLELYNVNRFLFYDKYFDILDNVCTI